MQERLEENYEAFQRLRANLNDTELFAKKIDEHLTEKISLPEIEGLMENSKNIAFEPDELQTLDWLGYLFKAVESFLEDE